LLINKLKVSSKQLQEAIEAMGIGRRIAPVEIKTKGRFRKEHALYAIGLVRMVPKYRPFCQKLLFLVE